MYASKPWNVVDGMQIARAVQQQQQQQQQQEEEEEDDSRTRDSDGGGRSNVFTEELERRHTKQYLEYDILVAIEVSR